VSVVSFMAFVSTSLPETRSVDRSANGRLDGRRPLAHL